MFDPSVVRAEPRDRNAPVTQVYVVRDAARQQLVLMSLGTVGHPGVAASGCKITDHHLVVIESRTEAARDSARRLIQALDPSAALLPSSRPRRPRARPTTSGQTIG